MKIQTNRLKEVYGKWIKVVDNDERFYQVQGASEYILSTYCRLFRKTATGSYKLVPLKLGKIWREYEIKFDDEAAPRRMSINRLAGLVFFPDVQNAILEPFHDDWKWSSWRIDRLHLYVGSKEERQKQRVESILAKIEKREPEYDDKLKRHYFEGQYLISAEMKLAKKINSDYGNMKSRSLNQAVKKLYPRYQKTKICDEWRDNPDTFKEWWIANRYDYPEELQIDKDILSFGQANTYAPKYCCFVPRRINDVFTSSCSILKYSITKRKKKDGTVVYVIPPNAFNYGETFSAPNYFEALNEGRRRKAKLIERIVEEERSKGLMPTHILDAMTRWANLVKMGKIEMLEPTEEDLRMGGVI